MQPPQKKSALSESSVISSEISDSNENLAIRNSELISYIRTKTDRLLQVMGTVPLKSEELDDDTLITLDPIGIVTEAFEQVLDHLKDLNRDLTATRDELRAVFDSAGAGIVVVNARMEVTACNSYSRKQLFSGASDVLGRDLRTLVCLDGNECILEKILSTGGLVEQNNFHYKGRYYHLVGTPIKDSSGAIIQMVLFYTDITERLLAAKEIERLAFFDSLTGLPNRVLLKDRLSGMLSRSARNGEFVAVLFIDLDHFKEVNDTLGHSSGDRVLQFIAERLTGSLRHCDTVARLGGDEFVVLLEGVTDTEAVAEVAEKLLNALSQPIHLDDRELYTSASIGIAVYPEHGDTVEFLFQNADTAMYHAKGDGRNRCCFYTDEMRATALEMLAISSHLRHALERNEFHLLYQPQISLLTGRIVGAEVLLRWQHPELGLLPPERFIGMAEESGQILEIGSWVLMTACRQAVLWESLGFAPIRIAINLSSRQLRDSGLVKLVSSVLIQSGLAPARLELELTEGMLTEDFTGTCNLLNELKAMGVSLALDDFGTGYSSISYLRHFPLDRLKIDKSFVQDISEHSGDASTVIMDAVIALAHSLDLTVIAERIETLDHAILLKQRHCDELQGLCCSSPLALPEFESLLQKCSENPDFVLIKV